MNRKEKTETKGKKKIALVLGGGGSRGAYEIGVWQALREMDVHIDIVTGTSVGAINGAAIAQNVFAAACEMWHTLETEMVFDFSEVLKKKGASYTNLKEVLNQSLCEEEIRKAQVEFGVVTFEINSLTPKYLWKEEIPKGQLIDYVLASASCFPAVISYEIGRNKYIDGGYSDNLPIGMALDKGATQIIAVNLDGVGVVKKESLQRVEEMGIPIAIIESDWDLGNFLIFDRDNSSHIMRLGYLDTMKAFHAFDGNRYTFIKGQMDKRTLPVAEEVAELFDLDPKMIYSREIFMEHLVSQIGNVRSKGRRGLRETVDFDGFKRDLKQISSLKRMNDLQELRGMKQDLKEIRRELLISGKSAMLPSEGKLLNFLEKEGLL